jgi:glucose/mannose-6-phosphate isomerase
MERNEGILDELENIKKIDSRGMLTLVEKLPDMLEEGWTIADSHNLPKPEKINNIVMSGMGGSAMGGDIVAYVLRDKVKFPMVVNRNYTCPNFVDGGTLFFALSYSGNTEETISSFKEAAAKKARIICISSGGELKELAAKFKVPFIEIPKGLPPRAALGYILSAMLNVLYKLGIDSGLKQEIGDSVKLLRQLSKKRGASASSRENEVKQMALKLSGKIPVVLATEGTTYPAGLRWKTQLNENSKVTMLFSVFPELNHNDLVNYSFLKPGEHDFSFVILRDDAELERMKKRIEITKSLISGFVGGISEVWAQGRSRLEKLMSLIQFGDYLSVYLAVIAGIDPTPVEIIEKLKKELAR